MKQLKVKDLYNCLKIFTELQTENVFSSFITNSNYSILDDMYYLQDSGNKWLGSVFYNLYDVVKLDNNTFEENVELVMKKFIPMLKVKYEAKWNKIYNALLNNDYNVLEDYNITTKTTPKVKYTTTNYYNAFNTTTPVENGHTVVEPNGSNEVYDEVVKHGLDGTQPQKLITREIELRNNYIMVDIIFKDINSLLTLSIY